MFFSVVCAGMGAGFFGVLFGGQAKGVPAHGVHHARAAHAIEPADDIGGGIPFGMADMEAVPAGVREHVQYI